jgi:polysaccharide biosynthesis/export protein
MFRDNFPRSSEVFWKRMAVLIILPALFAAAGAAQSPAPAAESSAPPSTPKALPGLNDPAISGAPVDLGTYVIGANDVLNIDVFENKEFSKLYPVRTDGILTIPLFGDMKAEGLTPLQLKKQLTETFSEKLKDPEVSVTVWEVRSKKYIVAGQVRRPGSYPLIHPVTVFEAINEAGGFTDTFANKKNILIIRGTDPPRKFNFEDYLKNKNRDKNIQLQNGDTVYVK